MLTTKNLFSKTFSEIIFFFINKGFSKMDCWKILAIPIDEITSASIPISLKYDNLAK